MVEIAVLFSLVTYIFVHLRYKLWKMISLHSLGVRVRIKGWVCTYQFPKENKVENKQGEIMLLNYTMYNIYGNIIPQYNTAIIHP